MTPSENVEIIRALDHLAKTGLRDICSIIQSLLNELMKIERENYLQAEHYERTELRQGYANGFKHKGYQTPMGKLDLQVPQTRDGGFYPEALEKGERTHKALQAVVAEAYVQGVSTRSMRKVMHALCNFEITASQVSRMNALLDQELELFRNRPLGCFPYVYLDAIYLKIRHEGQVVPVAVLIAVGVNDQGYREILGVSVSLSEAEVHWRNFLSSLQKRGLRGIRLFTSDDHAGLRAALQAIFPSIPWQRCLFHLAQNARAYSTNKSTQAVLSQSVRDVYRCLTREEAKERVSRTVERLGKKASHFCEWLEEVYEEGLSYLSFPRDHWPRIRTVNVLERLNQEVRRRCRPLRLFPNESSCLRLVSAILMDYHEEWVTGRRYLMWEGEM